MEDSKVTVEIKNSNGNGIGFQYDLGIIYPYLDGLLQLLSKIQIAQDKKLFDDIFIKIMNKVGGEDADDTLDKIKKEIDYMFNGGKPKQNNRYKRNSKGRFTKDNSNKE